MVVLEARNRAGGRVEQARLPDGRLVQLGGELVGQFHAAYRGLADELGLTIVPGFGDQLSGEDVAMLAEGRVVGNGWPWMSDADRASYDAAAAEFAKLAAGVDPDDPWSHPDAERLDRISVGGWMRSCGATPNAIRARELATLALSAESVERTSLLSDLRKEAAAGARGFYDYEIWESGVVEEGSATVALRMAAELETSTRYATPVVRISIATRARSRRQPASCFGATPWSAPFPPGPLRANRHRRGLARAARVARPPASRARRQGLLLYPDSFWVPLGRTARPTWRHRRSAAAGRSATASSQPWSRPSASPRCSPPRRGSSRRS